MLSQTGGSFALGVGAASVLRAQAKPPACIVAEVDVKDQDGYARDFLPKTQANMKEFGGKFLGGGYNKTTGIFGEAPPTKEPGTPTAPPNLAINEGAGVALFRDAKDQIKCEVKP
jgi:hypothetical protein